MEFVLEVCGGEFFAVGADFLGREGAFDFLELVEGVH